jgi:membrane protein DedA with SNARE-associated domain
LAGVSLLFEPFWSGFLVFAGFRLGEHISRMERGLQVAALVGGVLLLLALLWWYRRMFARIAAARNASLPKLNE